MLWLAVRQSGLPLRLFDSSTCFLFPDGSVLSPDASLVRQDRWVALTPEQRRSFPPLCPDLVVELYRRNGAQLGWLLLPAERAVEIWSAGADTAPQRVEPALLLDGGNQFPGLRLELAEVWQV